MFNCPHTGVALAALIKLLKAGRVDKSERVVVISTAHGLKFSDFKVQYHQNQLGFPCQHANPPIELPRVWMPSRRRWRRRWRRGPKAMSGKMQPRKLGAGHAGHSRPSTPGQSPSRRLHAHRPNLELHFRVDTEVVEFMRAKGQGTSSASTSTAATATRPSRRPSASSPPSKGRSGRSCSPPA